MVGGDDLPPGSKGQPHQLSVKGVEVDQICASHQRSEPLRRAVPFDLIGPHRPGRPRSPGGHHHPNSLLVQVGRQEPGDGNRPPDLGVKRLGVEEYPHSQGPMGWACHGTG